MLGTTVNTIFDCKINKIIYLNIKDLFVVFGAKK